MSGCHKKICSTMLLAGLLAGCSLNPFTGDNHLTGSPTGVLVGGVAGAGGAALLGADKPLIIWSGLGGALIGYYFTTLDFDAGGVRAAGGTVLVQGQYVTISLPADNLFDVNSAELLPESASALDSAVKILERFPDDNIVVSGNTSGYAAPMLEQRLSERRAKRVAGYLWAGGINSLKDNGINSRRMTYVGYGDRFPISSDLTAPGVATNSRIQITGYPSRCYFRTDKNGDELENIGALDDKGPDSLHCRSMPKRIVRGKVYKDDAY